MTCQNRIKAVFNWSGGKDSALALHKALTSGEYEIVSLLTTTNRATQRSSMHGIPQSLLQKQADSIGIPLHLTGLTPDGSMTDYQEAMTGAVEHFKEMGVTHFVFGDIFLHDVRSYREKQLAPYGISVVEPLWGKSTGQVMSEFLDSGLQTVIVTTMADALGKEFIGRKIDRELIRTFPPGTDVCGENGEYHTFCYAGGMFRTPVCYRLGVPRLQTYPVRHDDDSVKHYSYWLAGLEENG